MWDAGTTGRCLAYYSTVLAPQDSLNRSACILTQLLIYSNNLRQCKKGQIMLGFGVFKMLFIGGNLMKIILKQGWTFLFVCLMKN